MTKNFERNVSFLKDTNETRKEIAKYVTTRTIWWKYSANILSIKNIEDRFIVIDASFTLIPNKHLSLITVYRSSPNPNAVSLLNANGTVIFHTEYKGPHPEFHYERTPYNAYAPNGAVEVMLLAHAVTFQTFCLHFMINLFKFSRINNLWGHCPWCTLCIGYS